jgi:peptide-methionine (S)-S-oxide reductase
LPGVYRTTVGYAGGEVEKPTYWSIGDHTETVRVEFNPQEISYQELLKVFWAAHNPGYNTTNRQYRNAVFYLNDEQRKAAETTRAAVAARIGVPVQTDIEPQRQFYPAEDYHQKYYLRSNGTFLREFKRIYADEKQLAASTAVARVNGYLGCYGDKLEIEQELGRLGLSHAAQQRLAEHLSSACQSLQGITCPAAK